MERGGDAYDCVEEGEKGGRGGTAGVCEGDREFLAVEVADEVLDGDEDPVELFLQLVGVFLATTGQRGRRQLFERVEEESGGLFGRGAADVADGVLLLLRGPLVLVVILVNQIASHRRLLSVVETQQPHGDLQPRLQRGFIDGESEVCDGTREDGRLTEVADDLVADAERLVEAVAQIHAVVDELGP